MLKVDESVTFAVSFAEPTDRVENPSSALPMRLAEFNSP
jgi:hypothetical protein